MDTQSDTSGKEPKAHDAVRREIVETKLTDFYATHCPSKIHHVREIYEAYAEDLPQLFRTLLDKYPRAPRNTFEEVRQLIDAAPACPRTDMGGSSSTDDHLHDRMAPLTVAGLLDDGDQLLAASPPPPPMPTQAALNAQLAEAAASELHSIVEENLRLAQQVADAELAVLHTRFRVLMARAVRAGAADQAPDATMCIADANRSFEVAVNSVLWRYMMEGVLACPGARSLTSECKVACAVHAPSTRDQPLAADSNLVAAAMREWAAALPHTVSEVLHGHHRRFFSGSLLWWMWPAPPQRKEKPPAVSLFADATDGSDKAISRHVHLHEVSESDADQTAGAIGGALGDRPGFWAHFANHWDVLRRSAVHDT